MSLKTMTLAAGTTLGVTGGTPIVFAENGVTIANGLQLMVPADADYQTRRVCTIKNRPPSLNAKTGVYGKDKKSMSLSLPLVLTDGSVVFNTVRIEREVHPSLSAANALELITLAAQMFFDTDCVAFWANGSLT